MSKCLRLIRRKEGGGRATRSSRVSLSFDGGPVVANKRRKSNRPCSKREPQTFSSPLRQLYKFCILKQTARERRQLATGSPLGRAWEGPTCGRPSRKRNKQMPLKTANNESGESIIFGVLSISCCCANMPAVGRRSRALAFS